ncbi:unnamed protein product (macronuclear) [Paramecium tetraurelia]|uniref:Transmembrane protein n=1 Tax=Paramecium tetraurelia TaxID=5888 RepID=A0BZY1_PARTE|nr:uncharacterized protein GSPATT00005950001 [Paramecium tetraurelia]CAK64098.1 unnamed protein product [Paramecium tetraurelia]|eukprot:XP_001431496.1 hypothetical protein (macronuclear) [Paramecium tetraurelia strain d4-2]
MTSQQQSQTFVPIVLSQEEYNQILSQPAYLHQQLLQEIYQKKQQQPQLQQQVQVHPYQQFQQQALNQPQSTAVLINIPQIPNHPNQPNYVYQQGVQPLPQYVQYQQQNPNQNLNIIQNPLQHKSIQKAGNLELKYFYEWSTYLFMLEICISLFTNTNSAFFNWELVTNNYQWNSTLWVVLILFIILNLFILTNPTYVTQKNNQKLYYWIHVLLFVLLMQGLQTAISGSAEVFSWNTNYFYYFYLLICVEFISVRIAIKRHGVKKPIQEYLGYLIAAPVVTYFLELICQDYFYIYTPLLIWVIFVILIGVGQIFIISKIIEKGYNKFQTKDVFAMAISFPILLVCPFFDEE